MKTGTTRTRATARQCIYEGCGRRALRYSSLCRMHEAEDSRRRRDAVRAVVATGRCPQCGAGLRHNLALAGWWQCEQYGAEQFRADPNKPPCNWQGFTE